MERQPTVNADNFPSDTIHTVPSGTSSYRSRVSGSVFLHQCSLSKRECIRRPHVRRERSSQAYLGEVAGDVSDASPPSSLFAEHTTPTSGELLRRPTAGLSDVHSLSQALPAVQAPPSLRSTNPQASFCTKLGYVKTHGVLPREEVH